MCRIAAYFGPPIRLSALISETSHGLLRQSYAPLEMTDGTLNADGWGVGWFAPELGPQPGLLKGTQPIWSDENATTAAHAIASRSIVAIVRGATPGLGISQMNTPPYAYGEHLFAHNGRFWPWPGVFARDLRQRLALEDEVAVRGTTDTELFGSLWQTMLRERGDRDPAAALRDALRVTSELARAHGGGIVANVAVTWAEGCLAVRFASSGTPPSLYLRQETGGEDRGTFLASEPLDELGGWKAVPPSSLVRVGNTGIRVEPLS